MRDLFDKFLETRQIRSPEGKEAIPHFSLIFTFFGVARISRTWACLNLSACFSSFFGHQITSIFISGLCLPTTVGEADSSWIVLSQTFLAIRWKSDN